MSELLAWNYYPERFLGNSMEYKGGISVSHHNIGIDEFERLSPLMDNPRKSKQRYSEKEYYSGIINIMNINGIELQISLFSVDIPDGNL